MTVSLARASQSTPERRHLRGRLGQRTRRWHLVSWKPSLVSTVGGALRPRCTGTRPRFPRRRRIPERPAHTLTPWTRLCRDTPPPCFRESPLSRTPLVLRPRPPGSQDHGVTRVYCPLPALKQTTPWRILCPSPSLPWQKGSGRKPVYLEQITEVEEHVCGRSQGTRALKPWIPSYPTASQRHRPHTRPPDLVVNLSSARIERSEASGLLTETSVNRSQDRGRGAVNAVLTGPTPRVAQPRSA